MHTHSTKQLRDDVTVDGRELPVNAIGTATERAATICPQNAMTHKNTHTRKHNTQYTLHTPAT